MRQIKKIGRCIQLGVVLFFLVACNDEYIPGDTIRQQTPGSVAQIELFTNTEEFEKPITRNALADENNIQGSMPWVLVFRGDNNNAVFFEASRAIMSNSKLFVELTKTTSKSRLLIIANPPDKFFDGTTDNRNFDKVNIEAALSGKTYTQALTVLNSQKLNSPQVTIPYRGGYLPMSGLIALNTINDQTTIGTPADKMQLTRMLAKVTVENTASGFVLDGFTVVGAKQYGRFIQVAPAIGSGNKVNYLAQAPADPVSGISNGKDPVYIYESSAGETSVIVKGKYNGVTGYYRLVFKSANNTEMNIVRNKWYQFKIKSVKIFGYKTKEEAMAAPPSNIMAELLVIDENSMEITDNGLYYIGMSNSEFILHSSSVHTGLTAVTMTTNAPVGTLIKVEVTSENIAGSMTVSSNNIIPNGTVKKMEVKINLNNQFVSGILKITVGNLIRFVKVERKPIISWQETILTFSPGYVAARIESQGNSGDEWMTLSTDGVKYVDSEVVRSDSPGMIYLKLKKNGLGRLSRNGGIVYLNRKDSEGHLKLYIQQYGNPYV